MRLSNPTTTLLRVLVLILTAALTLAGTTTLTYPNFQQLNVKEAIKSTTTRHRPPKPKPKPKHIPKPTQEDDHKIKKPIKLDVFHRDHLNANSPAHNHTTRFSLRMQRDAARVASLTRRLKPSAADRIYGVSEFGSDVVSGMDQGSGEYFVRIGVGSPAREQYMVIDSGSDVVWVQCQPCNLCYKQSDPVFNPSESASFSGVSCGSELCDRVGTSNCRSGRCRYEVQYSDGSYSKGTLALETLTVGSTAIKNVAIGCGHMNRGMFIGAAGLMGLGGGSLSLVGQLGGQTGGAFSYCLVSRGSGSTGSLQFGREYLPVGAAWINLVRNPQEPTFYYVGLSGLGVGGLRVPVSDSLFDGGVVMDTGTAVTRLPTDAYEAFRDAFVQQAGAQLPRGPALSIFDTCYNLEGFVSVRVPTVSFYFQEGPVLTLPARNFLIPVDERGTFCFAFAPSSSGLSIIGNIQQEGIQISIDGANGFVGFGPTVC